MATTARGFRYPVSSDSANVQQYFQNLASDTDSYTRFGVYASIAARNAAIPSPTAGLYCLVAGVPHIHDGTNWRFTLYVDISGTGDGSGLLSAAHGGGRTPTKWSVSQNSTGVDSVNYVLKVIKWSSDSTNLTVRAVNTSSGAYMASNPINATATVWF